MRILLTATLVIAAATTTYAQPTDNHANWIGVWQAKLDGIPSLELTLGDDDGQLNGTVVFHAVLKEKGGQPHIGSTEPHTLMHPKFEGNTLTFQIIRSHSDNKILNMTVALGPNNKAQFTCENCGPKTQAELERIPLRNAPPANPD